jgi:hypothetical protein
MYDYDFMDYTIRVLRKCKEYGFKVYMDPHQDIVSHYSTIYKSHFYLITKTTFFMTRRRRVFPLSARPSGMPLSAN